MHGYQETAETAKTLHFDIETRSTADLKKVGAYKYARHPSTEVHCVTYAVGDHGPVKLWLPGDAVPEPFVSAQEARWICVAHNAIFDWLILQHILVPRHGFPAIPLEQMRCSSAVVKTVGLPGGLGLAAIALDLPEEFRKDKAGAFVMKQMAKPRKARKNEDPDELHWHEDAGRQERLYEYGRGDTASEREIWVQLRSRRLSEFEQRVWLLDQRINGRGFCVDLELARSCKAVAEAVVKEIDRDLARITNGAITSIGQVAKTVQWLQGAGVTIKNLQKETVEETLQNTLLPVPARQVLELRLSGAAAAVKKAAAFIDRTEDDGRLRGAFEYHGAHTGRWASRGVQVQNMKKFESDDIEILIAAVHSRDLDRIRDVHPRPLELLGNLSRSMIVAAPGKQLLFIDYSAIESRVLAWLAGEEWKLAAYRKFDITRASADEIYVILGSRMTGTPISSVTGKKHPLRVIGKTSDLACGYQGWAPAIERFAPNKWTEEERKRMAKQWRDQHPRTVAFWKQLERAMWDAVATCSTIDCFPVSFVMKGSGLWLRVRLPSGRYLFYAHPANSRANSAKPEINYRKFKGNAWVVESLYGGKLSENITQAIARDILAEALVRLDVASFSIIGHIHDEIILELPAGEDREQEVIEIMTQPPSWAPDLPIAANSTTGLRFT
jgi:DNA polymerase bacteriophage-type